MSNKILSTRILLLNGSQSEWIAKKGAVLKKGEPGVEFISDVGTSLTNVKIKIGDGAHTWEELPYIGEEFTKQCIKALADDQTIEFNTDGKLQLKSFDKGYYKYTPAETDDEGNITKPSTYKYTEGFIDGLEPRIITVDGKFVIAWYEPSTETAEGINAKISALEAVIEGLPKKDTNTVTEVTKGDKITVTDNGTDGNHNYTISHEAVAEPTVQEGTGRTYITDLEFDGYGHVTGYKTATETVENTDTNTAHTHVDGTGIKLETGSNGGVDGAVKLGLNLKFGTLTEDNKLQLLDATTNALVAEFDAAEFVEDSYLNAVTYTENDNILTFTFTLSDGSTKTVDVDLKHLVDVYNADEATLTKSDNTFSIKDGGVITAKIADKNVTKAKLAEDVQESLDKANSALQSHQDISGKADKVAGAINGNFAGLDANGNLIDSGKKASDFATSNHNHDAEYAPIDINVGVTSITSNDTADTDIDNDEVNDTQAASGLKVTTSEDSHTVNIEIDDTVTFILDGGTAANL